MVDPNRSTAKRCPVCGARYRASRKSCAHDGARLEAVPHDPLLGETLAQSYVIERPLGRGGMGALYVAQQIRLDRTVAIKVLHESFAQHELALKRFFREAQAMAKVRSAHVVQVIDALRAPDGRPCLVLEHLHGVDLQEHLRQHKTLSPVELLELGIALCKGLEAVHAAGIVHRDLKPSNVFLDESGVAKLLDFGVAHLDDDASLTKTGTVVGTPTYMAPEQVRGAAGVDGRADIYGLGAVLYRAATGTPPYGTGPATAVLSAVLEGPPEAPSAVDPDIPFDIETWILRAMSRDPRTRFQTPEEMRHQAERLLRLRAPKERSSIASTLAVATASAGAVGASGAALCLLHGQSVAIAGGVGAGLAVALSAALAHRWLRTEDPTAEARVASASLRAGLIGLGTLCLIAAGMGGGTKSWQLLAAFGVATVAGLVQRSRSKRVSPSLVAMTAKGSSQSTEPASESRPAMQRTPSLSNAT